MKKVLMIINPRAGKNSKRVNTGEIVKAFREFDIECFEKTTTAPGDATIFAKEYAKDFDAVACCGGDGTYNEVLNGLLQAGIDVPIIYMPYGSTNDFANTLGLRRDPKEAARMYVEDMSNRYDIGTFNDKFFSYVASFGLATEIAYSTPQKLKNMLGHTAYMINGFVIKLIPMLKNLKPVHMKIEYDGGVIEDDFIFGAVGNTNEISGLFKLDKCGVKMNDGVLEVILVKKLNVIKDAPVIFAKMLQQDYSHEKIEMFKTTKLKITCSDNVPWTLDGEFGGIQNNVDIGVKKQAVEVVSPGCKYLD